MKQQKAFTLVELMVVMAIISILATAGLYAYSSYMKKSRDTVRGQMAQKIESTVTSLIGPPGGVSPTRTALAETLTSNFGGLKDPVGGKNVCLGTDNLANEPCRFDYVLYDDGTYSISYGIESSSNMGTNFYQTTPNTSTGTTLTKVGIYRGTATFIGTVAKPVVGQPNVDSYKPTYPNGNIMTPTPNTQALAGGRIDTVVNPSSGNSSGVICNPECPLPAVCTEEGCLCGETLGCTLPDHICSSLAEGLPLTCQILGGGGGGGFVF